MLTNWLLDHRWAGPTAVAVLVVLGPVVGAWLAGRRRTAGWLTVAAVLVVGALTLTPTPRGGVGEVTCTVQWSVPTFGRVELLANVVLFAAPALVAAVATRRPLLVAGAGVAVSAGVEVVQALAPALGRSCDTTDWLSNGLGAAAGAGLGAVALVLHGRATRSGATR